MATVRITDAVDVLSVDPERQGQMDTMVTYMVGDRGPFFHYSPKTGFNIEAVKRDIQTTERERQKVVGQTFEV